MLKTVVLISCSNQKRSELCAAKKLYTSPLFKKSLSYAIQLQPDNIFILSAKHRLLGLDDLTSPYNHTLNNMCLSERQDWSNGVIQQLQAVNPLRETRFIILAGVKYRQFLMPYLVDTEIPLAGLGIGKQLQKLNKLIDKAISDD